VAQIKLGFLGLGMMGLPMTRKLLRGGFAVAGFDLQATAATVLQGEAGYRVASSPDDAAKDADVLILMLPSSKVVNDLLWTQGLV